MAARVHQTRKELAAGGAVQQHQSPASSREEAPSNQEPATLPNTTTTTSSSSSSRKSYVTFADAHAPTPTPSRPQQRPSTSPMLHTSHAKILQLQEYRERVQSACQSTYQFSLRPPRKPSAAAQDDKKRRAKHGYCRSYVLASSKQFFHAREPSPSHFSTPVGHGKDHVLPHTSGAHVNFHQMTPRRDEFLFGDRTGSTSRRPRVAHGSDRALGIGKDHFALGPGQYDVANLRPKTAAAVKFSPSDRFHDAISTAQLGPGQYITSDELTTPRAAVAVFLQTPRQTEASLLVSPTANTVSNYYYVPASSFVDRNARQNDHPSWPRAPRLSSRRCTTASIEAQKHRTESNPTDFVAKNRTAVMEQRAVQRVRVAREQQGRLERRRRRDDSASDSDDDNGEDGSSKAPVTLFRRRSSIFCDADTPGPQSEQQQSPQHQEVVVASKSQTHLRRLSGGSNSAIAFPVSKVLIIQESARSDRTMRALITLASLSTFSVRLARTYHLVSILRRIESAKRQHVQRVVFSEWRAVDHACSMQHAMRVILVNSFRYRFQLRIRRKCAHVAILRQFLGGLSLDVQFAIAMKKIKRKIQLIQRWWRHVQLMVRAREEALYHKWISVETRLRLEYVNQMPHLQSIFQQPAASAGAAGGVGTMTSSTSLSMYPSGASFSLPSSSSGHNSSVTASRESDVTLQKLLNLPEQNKWFSAHFVLTSDACLRGYSSGSKELVVEVKNYRCNFHDGAADSSAGEFSSLVDALGGGAANGDLARSQAYAGHSNTRWKPFLMVFRHGALRFVLLTSPSPMPTEILAWKDRLERLAMTPSGTCGSNLLSSSGSGSGSESALGSHVRSTVGDFVEMSMQSGVLASNAGSSSSTHSGNLLTMSAAISSGMGSAQMSGGTSPRNLAAAPRGRLQGRMNTIRQRNRMGVPLSEGELTYYVVDLLKDFPKVPAALVWQTIREKLREERKNFRAEIYRYNLELFHFHRHQEQTKHIRVLDKFKDFFTLERPKRPHFRSLVSTRKMEILIRQTIEQLKTSVPSNPRYLLEAAKASAGS